MKRLIPALGAFLLTIVMVFPWTQRLPEHPDEAIYAWSGAYVDGLLARLDVRPTGTNALTDPGWDPDNEWSAVEPEGARYVYGLALALTNAHPPAVPFTYSRAHLLAIPADTRLDHYALTVMRLTSLLATALGLSLLAWRFRWPGALAVALFLAIPHVPPDMGNAFLDGFLILGFGLCALTYGTRWFGPVCGVAAAFKLTALGAWPLLLLPKASGRWRPILGVISAFLTWTVLMPPSWFAGGPAYLFVMLAYRRASDAGQSALMHDPFWSPWLQSIVPWAYFPTRYLLPFELAGLLTLAAGGPWLFAKLHHWQSVFSRFAQTVARGRRETPASVSSSPSRPESPSSRRSPVLP